MVGCGAGAEGDWVDDGADDDGGAAAAAAVAVEVGMERGDFADE